MPSAHSLRRLRHVLLVAGITSIAAGGCQADSDLGQRLFEFSPMFRYGCNTMHHDRGDAPVSKPSKIVNQGRPAPASTAGGPSLLDEYAPRPDDEIKASEADTWQLPFQTKRVVVALLTMAAHDDIEKLDLVLTPYARWGLPDRREWGGKPVFTKDGPQEFFDALREAAARFPAKGTLRVPPQPNSAQFYVRHGAEPMWAYYTGGSPQSPDILAFKMVIEDGAARIDYIGFNAHNPPTALEQMAIRSTNDPPPPLKPRIMPGSMGERPPLPTMVPGGAPMPGAPGSPMPGAPVMPRVIAPPGAGAPTPGGPAPTPGAPAPTKAAPAGGH
ncbi:MAG: hypothetical protein KC468_16250 [Myxococcales bacterium]|nr:hypothetical protein [Myxococcales bacterium]